MKKFIMPTLPNSTRPLSEQLKSAQKQLSLRRWYAEIHVGKKLTQTKKHTYFECDDMFDKTIEKSMDVWKPPTRDEREFIENCYLDIVRAQIRIDLIKNEMKRLGELK